MLRDLLTLACLFALLQVPEVRAEQPPLETPVTRHVVTGLFSPERIADLRALCAELPEIELVSIDFERAEASFAYDPARAFPDARTPEQLVERLDNLLRNASRHTFGARPARTTSWEELRRVEIPVRGLDCKGCCLGAYDAIYRLEGVEAATASFRDGLVTAWIEPARIGRAELEAALKQRGVTFPGSP